MRTRPIWITTAFVLWGSAVAAGVVEMTRYESSAGETTAAPSEWPRQSAISRAPFGPTVVMFVHPQCPCTRASREELAEIIRDAPPTAKLVISSDPVEEQRFGAKTSGDVVAYDASGALRFHGGITIARGHVGHNLGHVRVDQIVHGSFAGVASTPVFGCAL